MAEKKLYPLKFVPLAARTEWGGDRFINVFGKSYTEKIRTTSSTGKPSYKEVPLTIDDRLGVSYEIADLGDKDSAVADGWLKDCTMSEIMETYLENMVGEYSYSCYGRQFPLMVRLLDVEGRTPLVVCPDDEIARQRYDTLGKAKLWYVMHADEGSSLYLGLSRTLTASEFYAKAIDGTLEEVLFKVTPHSGELFLIPPGMVHAASSGVLIAEITESSDLDFSIYGWGKKVTDSHVSFSYSPAGKGGTAAVEELSLEAAFDFIDFKGDGQTCRLGMLSDLMKSAETTIVKRNDLSVSAIDLKTPLHVNMGDTDVFTIYVCVSGAAEIIPSGGEGVKFGTGECVLVPASLEDFSIMPLAHGSALLEATLEPHEATDGYIDPEAEATLPEAQEGLGEGALESLLRGKTRES